METTLHQQDTLLLPPMEKKLGTYAELAFCVAIASTCLPVKVYPAVFLVSSILFYLDAPKIYFHHWAKSLAIFGIYALGSFFVVYDGQSSLVTNMVKLLVNFIFLFFSVNWLGQRNNAHLLKLLDYSFHVIFLLLFIQLLTYHQALQFRLLAGSDSSGQASMLYQHRLFFWGLEDKNMLGARIALMGFIYMLLPVIRVRRLVIWRVVLVFLLAYLSLSRTPVLALLIGCAYLVWAFSTKKYRIAMVVLLLLVMPFVLDKVLRIDQITASNDGMGVRLTYWTAFFRYFTAIPIWGLGFMGAPAFLEQYAAFYHGEPHIHNTFMSAYLELGIVGLLSFCAFFIYFIKMCYTATPVAHVWLAGFLPLLAIMCILYSGYDNDIVVYLALLFTVGSHYKHAITDIKIGLI